jgi:hypothetical protein
LLLDGYGLKTAAGRLFLDQLKVFPVQFSITGYELQQSKQAPEQDFEQKQMEYDKLKERTGYKNIQRMTNNLNVAYKKVAANKIAFLYENLDKAFRFNFRHPL